MRRRRLLEERIEWLDTFPHRMTVGSLLRALRIVHRSVEQLPAGNQTTKEAK